MKTRDLTAPCRLAELGLVQYGALRIAPMINLRRLLAEHGVDADTAIREVGCDPALFTDPENTIDFVAVGRLLVHAARVTGHPYPGLELGRRSGVDVLGAVGAALRYAPDLATGLRALILYFHLHDRGAVPSLREAHGEALFGYTLHCPNVPGTDHIYDAALVIARNVLSELCGESWKITEVRLFREKPADEDFFRRRFGAPVRFAAEHAAIVFPAADLTRPLPDANSGAYAQALRELEHLNGASDANGLNHKVRRLLHRVFISGAGTGGVDLSTTAQLFAVHPRTLNRRLRAEGTTFNALLAETRYEIARQLLRDTRLQVSDIAVILGYADSASFNHAFRRWSGATASAWRSSHGSS
jgi:AraC-like DNA-binding protein